jgi:hypothetical protein
MRPVRPTDFYGIPHTSITPSFVCRINCFPCDEMAWLSAGQDAAAS